MPTIIPIPAFSDNYIWLVQQGSRAAVVDPGDAAPVIAHLRHGGIQLVAIVATHHHGDHVGGIPDLLLQWRVPVYGPANEGIPGRSCALREGDSFEMPEVGVSMSVLDIPGHTSGHIACFGGGILFCGDTLFAAGCGRLFEGTPAQMLASLDKLAALPGETRVYCGHEYTVANLRFALAVEPGNGRLQERLSREQDKRGRGEVTLPSTIAEERLTNPFLRTGEPAIQAAVSRHAGRQLPDRVAVFAELRAWKNSFR
jgi:hydroxyacylglutathione hydrolase